MFAGSSVTDSANTAVRLRPVRPEAEKPVLCMGAEAASADLQTIYCPTAWGLTP